MSNRRTVMYRLRCKLEVMTVTSLYVRRRLQGADDRDLGPTSLDRCSYF